MSFDTKVWLTVLLCAVVTIAIRAFGPAAVGTRPLGLRVTRVLSLLPAALLAALVVTETVIVDGRLQIDARLAGVAVAAILVWRRVSIIWVVFAAAAVTAVLRLVF